MSLIEQDCDCDVCSAKGSSEARRSDVRRSLMRAILARALKRVEICFDSVDSARRGKHVTDEWKCANEMFRETASEETTADAKSFLKLLREEQLLSPDLERMFSFIAAHDIVHSVYLQRRNNDIKCGAIPSPSKDEYAREAIGFLHDCKTMIEHFLTDGRTGELSDGTKVIVPTYQEALDDIQKDVLTLQKQMEERERSGKVDYVTHAAFECNLEKALCNRTSG